VKTRNSEFEELFDEFPSAAEDHRSRRSGSPKEKTGRRKVRRVESEKNCEMCGRVIGDGEEELTLRDGKTVVCVDCYRLIALQRFGKE
jgi:hypothetical protein